MVVIGIARKAARMEGTGSVHREDLTASEVPVWDHRSIRATGDWRLPTVWGRVDLGQRARRRMEEEESAKELTKEK